jgi:UDP-2,3-diacylglucosamine pyrophosphatase LpxH
VKANAFEPRYRAVFISDLHLGTRGCQADLLLDFLRHVEADTWYLVGDIVDGWKLKRGWHWPQAHNDVVQKLLRKARKGARVVYVPGNHDEAFRPYGGLDFGGVECRTSAIHTGATGKRYLVIHGDAFDGVVTKAKWLALLGDLSYRALIRLNTVWNWGRRRLGLGYWSLSAFLKHRVKDAVSFIHDFESAVTNEARRRGCDGVICGHIHKAAIAEVDGVAYLNDGDWVESCTALVEHHDGRFEILEWARLRDWSMLERAQVSA